VWPEGQGLQKASRGASLHGLFDPVEPNARGGASHGNPSWKKLQTRAGGAGGRGEVQRGRDLQALRGG